MKPFIFFICKHPNLEKIEVVFSVLKSVQLAIYGDLNAHSRSRDLYLDVLSVYECI